jgi:hypothetical protein
MVAGMKLPANKIASGQRTLNERTNLRVSVVP